MFRSDRETLLNIVESRKFKIHIACLTLCLTNVLILNINECWKKTYLINGFFTVLLTSANYMGLLASTVTLTSWVLVDDISWLGKALVLLKVGTIMAICGAYFTIDFLNQGKEAFKSDPKYQKNIYWVPIVTTLNFIEGVIAIAVTTYIFIALDGRN